VSQPYIGEIRMFGGNFAPLDWHFCDGSLLAISDYEPLYNLIGTTYGGDGQQTFALPNLLGRLPLHQGGGFVVGGSGGQENVTLTVSTIPAHSHGAAAQSAGGTSSSPAGAVWAAANVSQYSTNSANATMNVGSTTGSGGSQPHNNFMPYVCVNFIIALYGIYPTQG